MKKLILLFFCISLTGVSCRQSLIRTDGHWSVMNKTELTLLFKYPHSSSLFQSDSHYGEQIIAPGSGISICNGSLPERKHLNFHSYFERSADTFGDDVCWQILSENGDVLKTWNYSDVAQSNHRFFEESSWKYNQTSGEWLTSTINKWTFDIIPEDITSTNQ